jgi:hypothetical protein
LVEGRQFEVYRVKGLRAGSAVDLAVILQDDTLSYLSTRVVAPLVPVPTDFTVDRATPAFDIDGVRYMAAVHLVTTIPMRNLGTLVTSLANRDHDLKNAIDMIFFGV